MCKDECNCKIGLELNYEYSGLVEDKARLFDIYYYGTNLEEAAKELFNSTFESFSFCPNCGRKIGKIDFELEIHSVDEYKCGYFDLILNETI